MIFEKRIEVILNILKKQRQVSNKILKSNLNISESTLRRDLDYLEKRGDIKRVHGGAILANIEFEEKNVDEDRSAIDYLVEKGHRGVPVINIEGEDIVGFNKELVDEKLGL